MVFEIKPPRFFAVTLSFKESYLVCIWIVSIFANFRFCNNLTIFIQQLLINLAQKVFGNDNALFFNSFWIHILVLSFFYTISHILTCIYDLRRILFSWIRPQDLLSFADWSNVFNVLITFYLFHLMGGGSIWHVGPPPFLVMRGGEMAAWPPIVGFQLNGKQPSFGDAITCKQNIK